MSYRVAPPFARQGLPKNPCRNLKTSKPAILLTNAVGTQSITNMENVTMYGKFLPKAGTSPT